MSEKPAGALSVSVRELSPVHVASVDYMPGAEPGDLHDEIQRCFERVQAWVKGLGLDPATLLHIGIPVLQEGKLVKYVCCVEVPASVQGGPQGDIAIQDLPGGVYAVLSMAKDPVIIGESIARFYQEYVPQNQIQMDTLCPIYEIYYESTMEYCVPILHRIAGGLEGA